MSDLNRMCLKALRAASALVAAVLVSSGWAAPASALTPRTVVVANAESNSISIFQVVDGVASAPVHLVDPAFKAPRCVAITPDNRFAAICNGTGEPGNIVWVDLTTSSPSVLGTTEVGSNAQWVALTDDKAAVAVRGEPHEVAIVDLASLKLDPPTAPAAAAVKRLAANTPGPPPVAFEGAHGVAITPDERYAVVTLRGTAATPGRVLYVDLRADTVLGTTELGYQDDAYVAVTPDGRRAVVTSTIGGVGSASVLDIASLPDPGTVIATVPVGVQPRGVAITPNGETAVIVLTGPDRAAIMDLTEPGFPFTLRPVGRNPFGVAVSPLPTLDPVPGGAVLAAVANDGSSGTPENETVSLLDLTPGPSFDIVGATNASPIRITTSLPHGFTSGQQVSVAGVQGNTAANGLFFIKIQSDDTDATFTLNGTTGSGNYTAGGIVVLVPERTDVVVGQRARAVAFTSVRAPHATLVAEPRTTKVGNEVQYDGSGSVDVDGTIEKYTFDFDDGTVITKVCATDPDPANCAKASHVYTRAGTFRAGLIVTDNDGATSRKDLAPSVAVRANRAPIAKFTMAPMSGRVPLVTTATDLSKDLDGTVVQRCWTLVAGNPVCDSTDANPTFTFIESGKHKVTLVVTDDSGTASKPYSKTVNVIPNKLPKATFTISPTSVKAGVAVTFKPKVSDADGQVVAYCWTFAEGSTGCDSTEPSPTHTYSTPGPVKATLVVTDDYGDQSAPYTRNITVRAP